MKNILLGLFLSVLTLCSASAIHVVNGDNTNHIITVFSLLNDSTIDLYVPASHSLELTGVGCMIGSAPVEDTADTHYLLAWNCDTAEWDAMTASRGATTAYSTYGTGITLGCVLGLTCAGGGWVRKILGDTHEESV